MVILQKPDKQDVRDWITKSISEKKPLPESIQDVRRALGWIISEKDDPRPRY